MRLGGAVEAGDREGIAADHGQHPARMGLHGHQGAVDRGHLACSRKPGRSSSGATKIRSPAPMPLAGPGPGHVLGDQYAGLRRRRRAHLHPAADAGDHGRRASRDARRAWAAVLASASQPAEVVTWATGAAPAVAAVVGLQPVHQGGPGGGLQARVQRRAHVVAALVEARPQDRQPAAAHLLDEKVGVTVLGAAGLGLDLQVLGLGGLGLGAGDPAQRRPSGRGPSCGGRSPASCGGSDGSCPAPWAGTPDRRIRPGRGRRSTCRSSCRPPRRRRRSGSPARSRSDRARGSAPSRASAPAAAASIASFSLRPMVTSLVSRTFLATCWVMVEPPSSRRPRASVDARSWPWRG